MIISNMAKNIKENGVLLYILTGNVTEISKWTQVIHKSYISLIPYNINIFKRCHDKWFHYIYIYLERCSKLSIEYEVFKICR